MEKKRFALFIDYLESVYAQRLFKGALSFFSSKNADFLIFPCGSINYQRKSFGYQRLAVASLINKNNFDGVIFVCGPQEVESTVDQIHSYLQSFINIPVVCIGHDFPDYPCIVHSSTESMTQLTEHLIVKHKCKNPAVFISKSPSNDLLQRVQAFSADLKKHGITIAKENILTCDNLSYTSAIDAIIAYKKRYGKFKFDSLVCMTDSLAFAAIDFLLSCHVRIPEDVIVTGFDDEDDAIAYSPTLTTINQNVEKQAYYAAKVLYKMVTKNRRFTDTVTIHSSVFFRQSCGCIKFGSSRNYRDFKGKEHFLKMNNSSYFDFSKWNYNKSSMTRIVHLYTNLETGILIDELAEKMESYFLSMKITSGAIVLFDKPIATDKFEYFPLPSKAHVLCSFDTEADLHYTSKESKTVFNPKEKLIPEGHVSTINEMTVMSLYTNSILYGYLMFKPGNLDFTIYGAFATMLSAAIAHASDSYKALKRKQELELENSNIRLVSVTDEMTGLLNRRGFMSHGKEAIANCIKYEKKGLVLFGDMDGLKSINDTYGHAAGDTAIKAEAAILKSLFRSSDIIGRLGGDEFAVVAPELNLQKFLEMKHILQEKCREYNETSGERFVISLRIGCAEFGLETECNIEKLLVMADDELYKEKQLKHKSAAKPSQE